jgi:hypothetical protein
MGKHEIGYPRVAHDLYPTREPWVTQVLLQHFRIRGLNTWEPATGEGHMAEILKAADPASVYCSDVIERGYPLDKIVDFTSAILLDLPLDGVITNPPFGSRGQLAERFIATGIEHIRFNGFLALLLPSDFDCAARRRQYFAQCPLFAAKIVLTTGSFGLSGTTANAGRRRKITPGTSGIASIPVRRASFMPPIRLGGLRHE